MKDVLSKTVVDGKMQAVPKNSDMKGIPKKNEFETSETNVQCDLERVGKRVYSGD